MRTAIIIGRRHGRKELELVSGPNVPIVEQKELFKDFRRIQAHDDYEYVELWISDAGRVKDRKLSSPKREQELADAKAKAEAEAQAKAEAEAKAKQDAEAKAKADADAKAKAEAVTNQTKSKKHEK